MLLKEKAKKVIAAVATAALAVTAIVPAGFTVPTIAADEVGGVQTWDFRDGSVIQNDTSLNGSTTVTSGNLTIIPGSQNGFGYNADGHGV